MNILIGILADVLVGAVGNATPLIVKAFEDGQIDGDEIKQIGKSLLPGLFGAVVKSTEHMNGTVMGESVSIPDKITIHLHIHVHQSNTSGSGETDDLSKPNK